MITKSFAALLPRLTNHVRWLLKRVRNVTGINLINMERLIFMAKQLYLIAHRNNNLDNLSNVFKKYVEYYDGLLELGNEKRVANADYVTITNIVFCISTEQTSRLSQEDLAIVNTITNLN